jgi:hypothetical protein
MLVLTIDQRGSRRLGDKVDEVLAKLTGERLVRGFERTAGDEVQALLDDYDQAVRLVLELAREDRWNIGVGLGAVIQPIPKSVRAANGPAFHHARDAVERAKSAARGVAVTGPKRAEAGDAEALLGLLAAVVQRRSAEGWEVVDLMDGERTQREVAQRLGITPQAVSQRVRAALWNEERRARPLAARLLKEADA